MSIFLGAFLMIFLAEMGDKSQLMAFTLASCYRVRTVLLGVFVATLIANGAAVVIGVSLGGLLNVELIAVISALAFLGFGTWRLLEKDDSKKKDVNKQFKCKLTSFFSIVFLFVLAETGDKTQIATAVYAATFDAPVLTLAGVTVGMLAADSVGIFLGNKLQKMVSQNTLRLASSLIFFIIGIITYVTASIEFPGKTALLFVILLIIFASLYFTQKAGTN